jgi:hypothetical protein
VNRQWRRARTAKAAKAYVHDTSVTATSSNLEIIQAKLAPLPISISNIYAPARTLQIESTYYQTTNLPIMSGLLNKFTDQLS